MNSNVSSKMRREYQIYELQLEFPYFERSLALYSTVMSISDESKSSDFFVN